MKRTSQFTVETRFNLPEGVIVGMRQITFDDRDLRFRIYATSSESTQDAEDKIVQAVEAIADSVEGVQLMVVS